MMREKVVLSYLILSYLILSCLISSLSAALDCAAFPVIFIMANSSTAPPDQLSLYFNHFYTTTNTHYIKDIKVANSSLKGRYLYNSSNCSIPAASLLFYETPLISVSDDEDQCIACNNVHEYVCTSYQTLYSPLKSLLSNIPLIAELFSFSPSRISAAIKFIAQTLNNNKNKENNTTNKTKKFTNSFAFGNVRNVNEGIISPSSSPYLLALFSLGNSLAGQTDEISLNCAHYMYNLLPALYQSQWSVEKLYQLLTILENNSHEVVDERNCSGEGLFPFFAMIEHNCKENCSFISINNTMYVYALKSIGAGESLSINYIPHYKPNLQRHHYLTQYFHFNCCCDTCTAAQPDTSRAFHCACNSIIYHYGLKVDLVPAYKCSSSSCSVEITQQRVDEWNKAEEKVLSLFDGSIDELAYEGNEERYDWAAILDNYSNRANEQLRTQSTLAHNFALFHPSHYILHHLARCLVPYCLAKRQYENAAELIKNRIANLGDYLAGNSKHWLIAAEYEQLGDVYKAMNVVKSAIESYERAEHSLMHCFGSSSSPLQALHTKLSILNK
jgi:tetratricopeptide (TPR) repeat protein